MKKLLFLVIFIYLFFTSPFFCQETKDTLTNKKNNLVLEKNDLTKSFITFMKEKENEPEKLSKITVGVAVGYNHLLQNIYDYSLTTDSEHKLKIEKLNRGSLVVSSALVFRFSKLERNKKTNQLLIRTFSNNLTETEEPAKTLSKLSGILSLNLLDINSDNGINFNKSIDGGIGLGYQIDANLNVAFLYELKKVRQLRSYIADAYENHSIPQGAEIYNALSTADNNLFYDKTLNGLSIKIIFNFSTL